MSVQRLRVSSEGTAIAKLDYTLNIAKKSFSIATLTSQDHALLFAFHRHHLL